MKLEKIIQQYNLCSDEDEQVEIIYEFDSLEDSSKWDFLLELLNDENTYDLVKIEIYKTIQIEEFNPEEIVKIKNVILKALIQETDVLVKQWGFISLEFNYCNFPDIIELCVDTLENIKEDEDLRYNALAVLKSSKNTKVLLSFQERLTKIKFPENINKSIVKIFDN